MNTASKTMRGLLSLQFLFVAFGILNSIFQVIDGSYRYLSLMPTTWFNLVAYVGILLYAVWGFRKSVVPMTVSVCALIAALTMGADRSLRLERIPWVSVILLLLAAVALVVYLNTFKKHKPAAMTAAIVAALLCLGWGIAILVIPDTVGGGAILTRQPFDYFFAASALATTYAYRCSWSKNGKEDILFI